MEKRTTEESNYLKALGERIRDRRIVKGLSQLALADKLGTSESQVRRIEKGEMNTTVLVLRKMAMSLNIAIKDLIGD